jgi:hypothetical protein
LGREREWEITKIPPVAHERQALQRNISERVARALNANGVRIDFVVIKIRFRCGETKEGHGLANTPALQNAVCGVNHFVNPILSNPVKSLFAVVANGLSIG